uniref:C2H2-type domain-containing protein n=1 Tax=Skeletonema marinoi TaxID=267567 RepID=A0A7S1VXI9_9STRA|mmetsp:Transcript_317/g.420  ORF Transcript_317/g.420 Transcript_317/m.420 type:complete len:217 (+) Transcript_317:222-872(+)
MPMISKTRTKWYLIECLSSMHLYHRNDNDLRSEWEEKLEHTCYNCGRQFMKNKSRFLHLPKHMHRCPGCQSYFDQNSSVDSVAKDMDHRRSGRSGFRLSVPLLIRSIASPRKKKEHQSARSRHTTTTTTVNCSTDKIESDRQNDEKVDGLIRHRKEQLNDDVIVDNSSCLADRDPCPFAFTYVTETVEPYQMHETDDESETHEVETYQLEWLLFNV